MEKMNCLIPMKGHSERVPNKNLRDFAGRPLYHAIVIEVLKSKYIKQVIINTDSEIIKLDALKNFGDRVKVIDRPKDIQGDLVSMNEIIKYDLSLIDGDYFMQTHSTNPLLTSNTIDHAYELFLSKQSEYDSLFSVTRYQARFFFKDGRPINHDPKELIRTQDLSPIYEENSNFFIFSRNSFKASNYKRIGMKPMMFEVGKLEAVDIDEHEDFELAELLYKRKLGVL